MIPIKCTGCKASLKLREEYAGKKVKCPRCKVALFVPQVEEEIAEPIVEAEEEDRVRTSPRARTGRTGRIQNEPPATAVRGRRNEPDRRDAEDEERGPKKKKKGGKETKYKPCPRCGAEGATRVKWTAWGSFYGPALFTHVCCPDCGNCYNGKTGRSNALAATLFVAVPLLGILGIIGAVIYVIVQRGHLQL